jgi:hypothetical protein
MVERRLTALLLALHDAGVEFIVVGGLAAVINGSPVNTYDVDVVHRRTSENVDRILPVLDALDAVYSVQLLLSPGHSNLITKYGPLDLLGAIGHDLGYEELLPKSTEVLIAEGVSARILNLETLIELKEQLNGEKDRAMLPILRQALAEKNGNPK